MKNCGVIFFFLFVFNNYESLASSSHLEWMLEKALRITNYKETKELTPVFAQLADALEVESTLSNDKMSEKLIFYSRSLRDFIPQLNQRLTPYKEISNILNRIKILISINNINFLLDDNTRFIRVKEDLEVNINSILSTARAINLNLGNEVEIKQVLGEIRLIQPEKSKNNKTRKIKKDLRIAMNHIMSRV